MELKGIEDNLRLWRKTDPSRRASTTTAIPDLIGCLALSSEQGSLRPHALADLISGKLVSAIKATGDPELQVLLETFRLTDDLATINLDGATGYAADRHPQLHWRKATIRRYEPKLIGRLATQLSSGFKPPEVPHTPPPASRSFAIPDDLVAYSDGSHRATEFQDIRSRATSSIHILGIGMTNISRYGLKTLQEQAAHVAVELTMLDPILLEQDKRLTELVEDFLQIPNFGPQVRNSFETLREFAERVNSQGADVTLRAYRTIPTMSMVAIDVDVPEHAEMIVEFFPYAAGEKRPRLLLRRHGIGGPYDHLLQSYIDIVASAEDVVSGTVR